jgi:hypothetical protein
MALDIIFLLDGSDWGRARFAKHKAQFPHAKKLVTKETGLAAYKAASKISLTNLFYVVDFNLDVDFDFSFVPTEFDQRYIHVWDYEDMHHNRRNGGVFLFNKKELRAAGDTLESVGEGIKYMNKLAAHTPKHDIVFISYDEPNAEDNWKDLVSRFPYALRVHGVEGILNAHIAAANLASTKNFFVVDGDSQIAPFFMFDLPLYEGEENFVHVWRSRNPVNGLEYGYGGVKLFHRSMFDHASTKYVDMSTMLGDGIKLMPGVASVTRFDSDRFHAFRGAFRECAKLANQNDTDSQDRLKAWTTVFTGPYAADVKNGALAGLRYGSSNADLTMINNFEWLRQIFADKYE